MRKRSYAESIAERGGRREAINAIQYKLRTHRIAPSARFRNSADSAITEIVPAAFSISDRKRSRLTLRRLVEEKIRSGLNVIIIWTVD